MRHIGNIRGNGFLAGDAGEAPAVYRIVVVEHRRQSSADGVMTAEPSALHAAFDANGATLRLETGESVKIVVRSVEGDQAKFVVSGQIPLASVNGEPAEPAP